MITPKGSVRSPHEPTEVKMLWSCRRLLRCLVWSTANLWHGSRVLYYINFMIHRRCSLLTKSSPWPQRRCPFKYISCLINMDARLRRVNKEITGMFGSIWYGDIAITKQIQDCKNDKSSQIKIDLIDESPFHLKGSFPGPQETPYEGGHFEVVSYGLVFWFACWGHCHRTS